jgi:NAD(P)-dependent dehydrogenase (short-subunit alcohol dehydrogenase family)
VQVKLEDKVIVVTGSTRGIGRAIAEACAEDGARVVICSRNEGAVKQAVEDFTRQGFEATGIAVDVSLQNELEKLLQHTIETWGRVDVWVNNAGLSGGYRPLDEMSPEEITGIVDVNFTGTLRACRMVIPYFIRQEGGILINISGKGGRGDASSFMAVYAATKAAVTSLTKSLAQENKDHPISIHSIVPGMVATDFYTDVKTSPKVSEIAESLPYVLKALGVPLDVVGRFVAGVAAQEPGKVTGKDYSVLKGSRLIRGIALLAWYRLTGKIKGGG